MPKNSSLRRIAMRRVTEKAPDALDRLGDRLKTVGVGESDIVLSERTEAGAGDRRHALLVEQFALETAGIVPGPGNIREGVERTTRIDAAYARQAVERSDDDLAPFGEGAHHPLHRLARTLERRDPGILRRRVDAGVAVDRKPLGIGEQRLRPHAVAHAPPGHRIGLAPAVEQDQPLAQGWVLQQADMLGAVI